MIFWKDRALAENLLRNEVSENQQFFYFIILSIGSEINSTLLSNLGTASSYDNALDYLCTVGYAAIIASTFLVNKKGDHSNFIVRFVCLSIPIALRTSFIACIFTLPAFVVDNFKIISTVKTHMSDAELHAWTDKMSVGPAGLTLCGILLLYSAYRYVVSFRIASGQSR